MDHEDRMWLEQKFTGVHEILKEDRDTLHRRIDEHTEDDKKSFKEIADAMTEMKLNAKELAAKPVEEHEERHHAIGLPKLILIIGTLAGVLGGLTSFGVWLWKHGN